jgi:UDP-glucose:(heptosyl)LPS alpha-1,3-glucosyltransferase
VIERFVPGAGGVENVAWQVAHGLQRAGEEVTVLTREASEGAGVSCLPLSVSRAWQPARVLGFSRAVARAAENAPRPFDLVHSFSRTLHQDIYRAGGGSHAEYLRHSHGPLARRLRWLSPRHQVLLAIEHRVFADPRQRIQSASQLVADALVDRHGVAPERIFLLPNGVDAERFAPEQRRAAAIALRERETHHPEQSGAAGPVWLFPGSGWRRKGLDRIFAALATPGASRHRAWVAGRDDPGAWRRLARRLGIADRVRFMGERDDLELLYAAVDGMLLPTRYDAFANVTLEAAAAGLPIVTTSTNGAAEWLADGACVVGRADDPKALAAALAGLEEPASRRHRGALARAAASKLDWGRHVEALRAEYRSVIEDRRARAPQ